MFLTGLWALCSEEGGFENLEMTKASFDWVGNKAEWGCARRNPGPHRLGTQRNCAEDKLLSHNCAQLYLLIEVLPQLSPTLQGRERAQSAFLTSRPTDSWHLEKSLFLNDKWKLSFYFLKELIALSQLLKWQLSFPDNAARCSSLQPVNSALTLTAPLSLPAEPQEKGRGLGACCPFQLLSCQHSAHSHPYGWCLQPRLSLHPRSQLHACSALLIPSCLATLHGTS